MVTTRVVASMVGRGGGTDVDVVLTEEVPVLLIVLLSTSFFFVPPSACRATKAMLSRPAVVLSLVFSMAIEYNICSDRMV
jgi:hypothetical protein